MLLGFDIHLKMYPTNKKIPSNKCLQIQNKYLYTKYRYIYFIFCILFYVFWFQEQLIPKNGFLDSKKDSIFCAGCIFFLKLLSNSTSYRILILKNPEISFFHESLNKKK